MHSSCLVRASCFNFLPTASAARPPIPLSISSKTSVRCEPTLSPDAGEKGGAPARRGGGWGGGLPDPLCDGGVFFWWGRRAGGFVWFFFSLPPPLPLGHI